MQQQVAAPAALAMFRPRGGPRETRLLVAKRGGGDDGGAKVALSGCSRLRLASFHVAFREPSEMEPKSKHRGGKLSSLWRAPKSGNSEHNESLLPPQVVARQPQLTPAPLARLAQPLFCLYNVCHSAFVTLLRAYVSFGAHDHLLAGRVEFKARTRPEWPPRWFAQMSPAD